MKLAKEILERLFIAGTTMSSNEIAEAIGHGKAMVVTDLKALKREGLVGFMTGQKYVLSAKGKNYCITRYGMILSDIKTNVVPIKETEVDSSQVKDVVADKERAFVLNAELDVIKKKINREPVEDLGLKVAFLEQASDVFGGESGKMFDRIAVDLREVL